MKIFVKAHPRSKKIKVLQKDASHYEIWVSQAPEKGRANMAVIEALSGHLGVARSRLTVSSGHASRNKIVEIEDKK